MSLIRRGGTSVSNADRKQLIGSIMFAFRAYFLNQTGAAVIASLHSNGDRGAVILRTVRMALPYWGSLLAGA